MVEGVAVTGERETVGQQLRARREAEALSLETVAERTRIPVRHLTAIETSDYPALPAAPYAVGFVKTYARLLGEPAEEAGRSFRVELDAAADTQPQTQAFEPADPARVPPLRLAVAGLIVAILIAAGVVAWRSGLFGADMPAERARLAASGDLDRPAAPATAHPAAQAPAPAAAANGPVVIVATGPAWIRVSDGDRRLFMDTMKPGDRFEVPTDAQAPVLRTAAAQAIRVTVGNTTLPPLGPASTLVEDVSLKPADLLARAGGAVPAAPPPEAAPTTPPSDRALPLRRVRRHRTALAAPPRPDAGDTAAAAQPPAADASAPAAATAPASPGA